MYIFICSSKQLQLLYDLIEILVLAQKWKNSFCDIAVLNWPYFHSLWAKSHEQGANLVAGSMYYLDSHQG